MFNTLRGKIQRSCQLIEKILICNTFAEKSKLVNALSTPDGPCLLSFVNAHAFNLAWKDANFHENLIDSDFLLRDGTGMKLLFSALGRSSGLNMNGTDFIPEYLANISAGKRLVVMGTEEPFLNIGVKKIEEFGANVLGAFHGFHQDSFYIDQIKILNPDIVVLAMGMPKQEQIAVNLRATLNGRDTLIINGGAIIDFLSGRFPRAPHRVRKIGMEWLYRLFQEPSRLWRRYLLGNFLFLLRLLCVKTFSIKGQTKII